MSGCVLRRPEEAPGIPNVARPEKCDVPIRRVAKYTEVGPQPPTVGVPESNTKTLLGLPFNTPHATRIALRRGSNGNMLAVDEPLSKTWADFTLFATTECKDFEAAGTASSEDRLK